VKTPPTIKTTVNNTVITKTTNDVNDNNYNLGQNTIYNIFMNDSCLGSPDPGYLKP